MPKKLVSVVVPIYNAEDTLERCLDSLVGQTYSGIEVILVNNGSSDSSKEICKRYAKDDKRFRYCETKIRGVSNARNIGVSKAKGDFITFVDADDVALETMVEDMLDIAIKEDVDVVNCCVNRQEKNGRWSKQDFFELAGKRVDKKNMLDVIRHYVTTEKNIAAYNCATLIKSEIVPKYDMRLTFMEDTVFFIELLMLCNSIYHSDKVVYSYYYNKTSASHDPKKMLDNIPSGIKAIEKIEKTLDKKYSITDELHYKIQVNKFCIVVSRLKILSESMDIRDVAQISEEVMNQEEVREVLSSVSGKGMSIMKKMQYNAVMKNKWNRFALLCKVSNLR